MKHPIALVLMSLFLTLAHAAAADDPNAQQAQREALQSALCADRTDCQLRTRLGSIPSAAGGRHEVWRTTFAEDTPSDETGCSMEEFWLVSRDVTGQVLHQRLFAGGCTRGSPSDSWCGVPPRTAVSVLGSKVVARWDSHAMRCMSAYHSSGSYEASLLTFAPLRETSSFYRILPPDELSRISWDFTALRGARVFSAANDACPAVWRGPTPVIPSATVAEAFVESSWRELDMAACSTRIDATHGFVVKGRRARAALRVLRSSEGTLFIDVEPPNEREALPKSASLQVCYADTVGLSYAYCQGAEEPTCADVRLDGSVSTGDLSVERAPLRPRFKIELPESAKAISVAYLEPSTNSSIASSSLRSGDPNELSEVFEISSERGSCEVDDAALRLKLHETK